jgi:hypothetical protein
LVYWGFPSPTFVFAFFFRISVSLLNFSSCYSLFHPCIELAFLLHSAVWILFEVIDDFKIYFCILSCISVSLIQLWHYELLENSYCLDFSYFLCFCIVICTPVRMNIFFFYSSFCGILSVESLLLWSHPYYYSKERNQAALTTTTPHIFKCIKLLETWIRLERKGARIFTGCPKIIRSRLSVWLMSVIVATQEVEMGADHGLTTAWAIEI